MIIGDPAWRVLDQDGILVATAGADQILYLDDVPGEVAAELQPCWNPDAPTGHSFSAAAHRAVSQLQPVGVVHFQVPCPPRPVLGFAGEDVGVASRVRDLLEWPDSGDPQLGVYVRARRRWADCVVPAWQEQQVPYLVVDLAASHTISLGPFVIPGFTACLTCLAGRVSSRWGDPELPSAPGSTEGPALSVAAGLVAVQLGHVVSGLYPLANRSISLDLHTGTSTTTPVIRGALCPDCGIPSSDGKVRLPWQ